MGHLHLNKVADVTLIFIGIEQHKFALPVLELVHLQEIMVNVPLDHILMWLEVVVKPVVQLRTRIVLQQDKIVVDV